MSGRELLFAVITTLFGFAGLSLWRQYHMEQYALVFLFLFIVFYAFTALYSDSGRARALMLLPLAASLYFLPRSWPYIVSIAAAVLLAGFSLMQIKRGRTENPGFNIWRTLRAGMPLFLSSLALLISVFYAAAAGSEEKVTLVSKPLFDTVYPYMIGTIGRSLGLPQTISVEATVDDVVRLELSRDPKTEALFRSLPPSSAAAVVAEARTKLAEQLGIRLSGSGLFRDALYETVNQKADGLIGNYRHFVPLVLAIGVFLSLKALSIPVYVLVIFICYGLSLMARRAGLLKVESVTYTVNRYSF